MVFVASALRPVLLPFFLCASCAPVVSGFRWFPAPGALGRGAVCCSFCWPAASRLSVLSCLFCASRPALGCSLVVAAPPPPPVLCFAVFVAVAPSSVVFFLLCAPVVFGFLWFPAPGALGLGAVCCLFCWPPASRVSVRSRLVVFPARPLAAPWWLLPPPPFRVSRFSLLLFGALFFFFGSLAVLAACPPPPGACVVPCAVWCCRAALPFRVACCAVVPRLVVLWAAARCAVFVGVFVCVLCCAVGCCCVLCPVSGRAVRLGCSRCGLLPGFGLRCRVPCCAVCPWVRCCALLLRLPVLCCGVLCCFVALVWCRCWLCRVLWRCPSPWGPVLCGVVFCGVPSRCLLCAMCVLSWRAGACSCLPLCCLLCVTWGVVLCVPCPLRSVRCCVPFCWCACVVLFVWCVLLLAPGAVVRCRVLCCFPWCSVVRCWVWQPVVVCWWCVLVSVSLPGRVVCFPVVGVVRCGALLPCVVSCGVVVLRGGWAVVLCCRFAVLFVLVLPFCGLSCCAVLCCWLAVLLFVRWWRLRAVVLVPSLPARTKKRITLITALCYPAPVSVSVVDAVGEVGLVVRRVIADPGRVVFEKVVLFVVVLACLQRNGGRTRRVWGRDGKGRYMEKKTKREGGSLEA